MKTLSSFSALTLATTLTATLVLTACAPQSPRLVAPITNAQALQFSAKRMNNEINNKVDILFVVDHSLSMDKHQDNWARNIDSFVSQFSKTSGVDYHVGVTLIYDTIHWGVPAGSCNAAGAVTHPVGELIPLKMSVMQGQHEVIKPLEVPGVDKDGKAIMKPYVGANYLTSETPNINNILGATLRVGVIPPSKDGPEFEEMFTPVIHAFSSACQASPTNAGFYRADAQLVVIFITDADDSSPVIKDGKMSPSWISPDDMFTGLKILKGGDASKVMVIGALSPIDEPDCAMDPSGKPYRNTHLVNMSGGTVLSLCSKNFGEKLAEAGDKIVRKTRRTVLDLPGVPDFNQPITVMYGNQVIPGDVDKGWSYDAENKKMVISGGADIKPQPGVEVTVTATYIKIANEGTKRVKRKSQMASVAAVAAQATAANSSSK